MSDAFEFGEPEFHKLVTTVIHDDDSQNIHNVTVGKCNQHASVGESKYEEKCKNELIVPGEYISKK